MPVSDFSRIPRVSEKLVPAENPKARTRESIRLRLENWISQLHRDPSAEESAAADRRALLLQELNRTVADAPDDVPIKYVIQRLNRHWDD